MGLCNFTRKCSNLFTVARVFALISIVAAHINFPDGSLYILGEIYTLIGTTGVIAFLFMSAYYYKPEKAANFLGGVLKKKIISIGIPWAFLGTLTYLYNAILSDNLGLIEWVKWILGYKTYLYFLTVLFLCFIIFYKANKIFCICCIPVSVVSLMLTAAGVLEPIIEFLHITDYLNVLNWIGVFAAGQLCRRADPKLVYTFIIKYRILWIVLFFVFSAIIIFFDIEVGYFSFVGIYFEVIGALCIFAVSSFKIFDTKLFENIANNSFAIYLIHMPIIGVFDRLYNLNIVLQIVSAVLVITFAHFGLELCRFVVSKIKIDKFVNPLFGFRNRSIS